MKFLGVFNDMDIRINGEDFINLTDIWKAAGSEQSKRPSMWLRLPHTHELLKTLENQVKGEKISRLKTKAGRYGGTYAHWQVALAYAKYLSPEFHMWCNNVVRRVLTVDPRLVEELIDLTIEVTDELSIEWTEKLA